MEWFKIYYRKEKITFMSDETLTTDDIPKLFAHVKNIRAETKEDAWRAMQAENWSPDGEARLLIEHLGLRHTSMSVGDVVYQVSTNTCWQVEMAGFAKVKEVK